MRAAVTRVGAARKFSPRCARHDARCMEELPSGSSRSLEGLWRRICRRRCSSGADGAFRRRVDFSMLPCSIRSHCVWSGVVRGLDLGGSRPDHFATVTQLQWSQQVKPPKSQPRWDRARVAKSVTRDSIRALKPPRWRTDTEHVSQIKSGLHDQLRAQCPVQRQGPKKGFITPERWQLPRKKYYSCSDTFDEARRPSARP